MATSVQLTPAEYQRLYGGETGWEYWFGEARRKPVPNQLHGILQGILFLLLRSVGYRASTETDLHILPRWYPRPDVTGISRSTPIEPYPTQAVDVVFEVLSEDEQRDEKCRLYKQAQVGQIFYFDPELRKIWQWQDGQLVSCMDVVLANGSVITGQQLWSEFERDLTVTSAARR